MLNILAIDDEETCLEIINFSLTSRGYQVFNAPSGEAAIEFLLAGVNKIDLILLDMMMPQMNGLATLEKILQIESAKYIPVIFQTGTSDYAPINKTQEQGNIDYVIRKPYKRDDLIKVVNMALAEKKVKEFI
jgi:two-component system alkaline phosphatase synthesis response regulator PhoP